MKQFNHSWLTVGALLLGIGCRRKWLVSAAAVAVLWADPSPVEAGVITTLFNSGVLGDGSLAPAGSTDLHYSATFVEMGGDIGLILPSPVLVPSFFPQSWVPNTATSRWVWASPPGSNPGYTEPGVYDYLMTFDLTGFDPASALITGRWAADNQGLDILVNGISTQQTALETAFTGFTIDPNNLLAQVNIVDFRVRNTLVNPAGIQIQFTQQSADAVPEPSTLTLFGLSLVGLVGWRAVTRSLPNSPH